MIRSGSNSIQSVAYITALGLKEKWCKNIGVQNNIPELKDIAAPDAV